MRGVKDNDKGHLADVGCAVSRCPEAMLLHLNSQLERAGRGCYLGDGLTYMTQDGGDSELASKSLFRARPVTCRLSPVHQEDLLAHLSLHCFRTMYNTRVFLYRDPFLRPAISSHCAVLPSEYPT